MHENYFTMNKYFIKNKVMIKSSIPVFQLCSLYPGVGKIVFTDVDVSISISNCWLRGQRNTGGMKKLTITYGPGTLSYLYRLYSNNHSTL